MSYPHSLSDITERTEPSSSRSPSQGPSNADQRSIHEEPYTKQFFNVQPLRTETIPQRLTHVRLPQVSSPRNPLRSPHEKEDESKPRKETKRKPSILGGEALSTDEIVELIESCFEGNGMIDLDFVVKEQEIISLFEDSQGRSFRFHIPKATHYLTREVSSRNYVIEIFPLPYGLSQGSAWRAALDWNLPEARCMLGGMVPKLATTGMIRDHRLVGTVRYDVYALPEKQKEGELMLLSQVWEEMSSSNQKAMVQQALSVRKQLWQQKFNEEGYRALNSHEKLGQPAREKWNINYLTQVSSHRRREPITLDYFSEAWAFTLLERFSDGLHPLLVLLSRGTYFVQTGGEDVKQAPLMPSHLSELRAHLQLTHLGLTPENLLVRRVPRRFRSPTYEIAHVLGWSEHLAYAPPQFDLAVLDARFGRSLKSPEYYHLFRGQVGANDIPESLSPAAVMNLNVLVHLISVARRSGHLRPRAKMVQDEREKWLKKQLYVYNQGAGWTRNTLVHRFKPKKSS